MQIKERFREDFVRLLASLYLWLKYTDSSRSVVQIPGCDMSPVRAWLLREWMDDGLMRPA